MAGKIKEEPKMKMMMLGEKETFLIRVLIKKLKEAGLDSEFITWDADELSSGWINGAVITLYMDEHRRPPEPVVKYMADRLLKEGSHIIIIGEAQDVQYVSELIPQGLIHKSLIRPIDNDAYVKSVGEMFELKKSNELLKSILIVDDDANYLGLVREWIKDTYKVAGVSSGLQALKWLGKNRADLILLDHEMPVTSGPQVLEMLRNDEETRNIPVIFLTGKSDKESVMKVVDLKPEGYFLKNIGKEELLAKLKHFFLHR